MIKKMTKKQKKMLYRILISVILLIPCLFIPEKYTLIRAIVFLLPYGIAGYDVILKACRNIRCGQIFDENFLMALATVGAYGLGEYFEAVMVVILYQAGELFQSCAVSHSRKSIAALMDIRPDYANLIKEDGTFETVSPESVKIGDRILIKSGEKIPLDCTVVSGTSEIDVSSLTGESVPVSVKAGDAIVSGSVNINGTLYAEATRLFGESTVSKILELTENSAERKSKSENFITKFAKYYTPIVCALALCMAVIPTLLFGNFSSNLKSALIFLVVSCPCALVISVPLSFFCGMGCASQNGILIKGGNYIEALSKTETIIFDKTGTLTVGKFEVINIEPHGEFTDEELLHYAAKAEYFSEHPIAAALKNAVPGINSDGIGENRQIIGKGIYAEVDKNKVYVGNAALMADNSIEFTESNRKETPLYVAVNGKFAGTVYVSDKIKADAQTAFAKLSKLGVKKTVMLTGDKSRIGEDVGNELGINEIHCELLPEDKVALAEKIIGKTASGKSTAYVGDGINDAPVLSRADIGIAMGGIGSDAAIEAADVVLMDDSLLKLPIALSIAKKNMRIVKENIVFAIGIKISVMLLSALGISSSMWLAIFADVGVCVLAILNALRTFKIKK